MAGGFGTRWLPLTKAIEKCMIPVGNRPAIDYVVQDCIKAGITDITFVVGEQSEQIQTFYGQNAFVENYLHDRGKITELHDVQRLATAATFHFVTQPQAVGDQYGTAVPLWICRDLLRPGEQVLLISGDQFYYHEDGFSETRHLLEKAEAAGTPSAMLAVEVLHEEVYKYGIVKSSLVGGHEIYQDIIEKPTVDEAPSNLNNATFWLFDSGILPFLETYMAQQQTSEYLVTDVANAYAAAGNHMAVVRARGEYLDCGTVESWLAANNRLLAT